MIYLWIAAGSALGGAARYWLMGAVAGFAGAVFPWGTLSVNVLGSSLVGFFAGMTAPEGRWLVSPTARQFVIIGIFGGFTTFSTFSLETLNLARDGQWLRAASNVLLSVVCCLVGAWAGHAAATALNR